MLILSAPKPLFKIKIWATLGVLKTPRASDLLTTRKWVCVVDNYPSETAQRSSMETYFFTLKKTLLTIAYQYLTIRLNIDALTCKQYFNIITGWGGANTSLTQTFFLYFDQVSLLKSWSANLELVTSYQINVAEYKRQIFPLKCSGVEVKATDAHKLFTSFEKSVKLGTLFAVLNYGFDIFLNGQRSSVINCYVVALADENKNIVFR